MKKVYKITFYAELNEDDVNAMQSCFYQAMNESMDIYGLYGLELEDTGATVPGDDDEIDNREVSFDQVLHVVMDWLSFLGDEDCENIAQNFSIGMSEGRSAMDILIETCSEYNLDVDEFEGICLDLEGLLDE